MAADNDPKKPSTKNDKNRAGQSDSRVNTSGEAASKTPQIIAMAMNPGSGSPPPDTSEGLLARAKDEAKAANKAMDAKELEAEQHGYQLIDTMLRLGLKFINPSSEWNQAALDAFLAKNKMKKHGNAKSNWQLISKLAFPKLTRPDRVTKFGQVLYALHRKGVAPDGVQNAFNAKPDPDNDSKAMRHSGMYRYLLLFKEYQQEDRAAEKDETDETEKPKNRYATMADDKLRREALLLLEALKEKKLVAASLDKVVAELTKPKP